MKYRINKMPCNGDTRYYIACSVRNKNRVSTKNVKSLGKHSILSIEHPDLEKYLQDELYKFNKEENEDLITLKFDPNKKIDNNSLVYGGDIFIKRVLDSMKMDQLLNNIQENNSFKFSLKDIIYFLISTRILRPDSKYGMWKNSLKKQLDDKISFSKDSIFRCMDVVLKNKDIILKHCYANEPKGIKRNKKILYYDCTNTYFESEFEDELRARGHGKRNEVEPLVSLGLVMDGSGIPLTYTVFKGSTNEQKTLIPLENTIINDFRNAEFIMITDAGLSSKENRSFNSLVNRKYITTLPVRKMSNEKLYNYIFDEKKEWESKDINFNTPKKIIDEYYRLSSILATKISEGADESETLKAIENLSNLTIYRRYAVLQDKRPKEHINEAKTNIYIDEDYLISFSLKYLIRQRKQRNKVVEKAKKLLNSKGVLKAKNSNDPKFYLKEVKINKSTGESSETIREINNNLIEEQEKLDGYYCVATNLHEDENETIIDSMKYRWFIEDSFRIMKQEFNFRPINHSRQDRIKCHFFTCFMSLLVYRYIQKYCEKIAFENGKQISNENLLNLLREYNFTRIKKDFLIPTYSISKELIKLEEIFNVNLSTEIITPSKLNKELKKQII